MTATPAFVRSERVSYELSQLRWAASDYIQAIGEGRSDSDLRLRALRAAGVTKALWTAERAQDRVRESNEELLQEYRSYDDYEEYGSDQMNLSKFYKFWYEDFDKVEAEFRSWIDGSTFGFLSLGVAFARLKRDEEFTQRFMKARVFLSSVPSRGGFREDWLEELLDFLVEKNDRANFRRLGYAPLFLEDFRTISFGTRNRLPSVMNTHKAMKCVVDYITEHPELLDV